MVKLQNAAGNYLVAASQNKDVLKLFKLNKKLRAIKLNADDVSATITFNNGKIQKQEFYYGSSFLSQSASFITIDSHMRTAEILNSEGVSRKIFFNK